MFATINHLFDFAGERQYAYVNIEYGLFNRSMADVTSHVGYAGSTKIGQEKKKKKRTTTCFRRRVRGRP